MAKVSPKRKKAKAPKVKRPVGRPSLYSTKLASELLARMVEGPMSLRRVCEADDMPDMRTFFRWLDAHPEFRQQYARALEERTEVHREDLLEIADDARNDWMERLDKDGKPIGWVVNGEHIQRSKLRSDNRKWIMERMSPKKYGTKVDVNHDATPGGALAGLLAKVSGTASSLPIIPNPPESDQP